MVSYNYRIRGWEILYPENRIYFCHIITFQHSGRRPWDLWHILLKMSWSGVGVWGCVFMIVIPHDCDIYVGESKLTLSSVTYLFIIIHITLSYTLHIIPYGELFLWDSPWEFLFILIEPSPLACVCVPFLVCMVHDRNGSGLIYIWCKFCK